MPHTQQPVVDLTIEIPQFESLQPAYGFLFESVDGSGVVLRHSMDQNTNRKQMVMVMTTMAL